VISIFNKLADSGEIVEAPQLSSAVILNVCRRGRPCVCPQVNCHPEPWCFRYAKVVREPGESRAVRRTVFREAVAQAAGNAENSDHAPVCRRQTTRAKDLGL